MYQTSLYPLRSIVGDAVKINAVGKPLKPEIHILEQSNQSMNLGIHYKFLSNADGYPLYKEFLPVIEGSGGTILTPGEGMDALPQLDSFPFLDITKGVSLFALSKKPKEEEISRELSVKLVIKLKEKALIGGICFGGFPFLPFKILESGQNSSNFGLPREIRVTIPDSKWDGNGPHLNTTHGFLDYESSVTRQEIVSHSGLHYLLTDPTLSDVLILYLSDYPYFLTKIKINKGRPELVEEPTPPEINEHYGFIIPHFYVFEYQEKTRYQPSVPAGLLGTRLNNISVSDGQAQDVDLVRFYSQVDYQTFWTKNAKQKYIEYTAASIFGPRRRFSNVFNHLDSSEIFISNPVPTNEKVTIFIQQSEEFERCIAGMKINFVFVPEVNFIEDLKRQIEKLYQRHNLPSPSGLGNVTRESIEAILRYKQTIWDPQVDFCEKIGIRIYELDPVDGVSPLNVELDGKYATLLAEKEIDELSESILMSLLEG